MWTFDSQNATHLPFVYKMVQNKQVTVLTWLGYKNTSISRVCSKLLAQPEPAKDTADSTVWGICSTSGWAAKSLLLDAVRELAGEEGHLSSPEAFT